MLGPLVDDPLPVGAREAANMMHTGIWVSNRQAYEQGGDMDCWQHDMLVNDEPHILEGVPFPEGCLTLWLKHNGKSLPRQGHPDTIDQPGVIESDTIEPAIKLGHSFGACVVRPGRC